MQEFQLPLDQAIYQDKFVIYAMNEDDHGFNIDMLQNDNRGHILGSLHLEMEKLL